MSPSGDKITEAAARDIVGTGRNGGELVRRGGAVPTSGDCHYVMIPSHAGRLSAGETSRRRENLSRYVPLFTEYLRAFP